jgi:hypothetical protein
VVTNVVDLPGYHDGPFARCPELLEQILFWHGHLYSCAQGDAGELLWGADYAWAEFRLPPPSWKAKDLSGPVHWTTVHGDVRVNDGRYSFRNPANDFVLTDDRMARVSAALAP